MYSITIEEEKEILKKVCIELDIIYSDELYLFIDRPAALTVNPAYLEKFYIKKIKIFSELVIKQTKLGSLL